MSGFKYKLKGLGGPRDMEDVQEMFKEIAKIYPNSVFHALTVGGNDSGMTMVHVDETSLSEEEIRQVGHNPSRYSMLMSLLTSELANVFSIYHMPRVKSVKKIYETTKKATVVFPDENAHNRSGGDLD